MGLYVFCLCFGFAGLLVMAILGHTHFSGHHGHGHGHVHGHTDIQTSHSAHGAAGSHGPSSQGHDAIGAGKSIALAWLSPRVLFSLVFAFGASGFLLRNLLPPIAVLFAALIFAWLFERWLIQPIWRVLSGFASEPAQTLESALFEEAEAVTNFDRRGHGLISLNLDGQVVQILGVLNDDDRRYGVRIRAGDRVSVTAVNTQRNSCTVARLPLAAPR